MAMFCPIQHKELFNIHPYKFWISKRLIWEIDFKSFQNKSVEINTFITFINGRIQNTCQIWRLF